jgi:hypothetical protein
VGDPDFHAVVVVLIAAVLARTGSTLSRNRFNVPSAADIGIANEWRRGFRRGLDDSDWTAAPQLSNHKFVNACAERHVRQLTKRHAECLTFEGAEELDDVLRVEVLGSGV